MYVCHVISILWILIVLKLGLDTQKAEDVFDDRVTLLGTIHQSL